MTARLLYIPPTKRRKMTKAKRVAVFLSANGICHICKTQIRDGEKWEVSHPDPLNLGGADDETNMRPAHKRCHVTQTKTDKADIAKRNKSIDRNHAKPERRQSRFKRRMDGSVVVRSTGQPVARRT